MGVCPLQWKKSLVPGHPLLFPWIPIHMVAIFFPETGPVLRYELNASDPFCARSTDEESRFLMDSHVPG